MFTVLRQTMRKRLQAKLSEVKTELRRRMHASRPGSGAMAALGGEWALPLLRSAYEHSRAAPVSVPEWAGSGIARCRGAARTAASSGTACGG